MHAPAKYVDRFPHLAPDRRIMAAMLSAVDDAVGAIMAEVERQGLGDSTCTVFTSDNGPSRETRNWMDGCKDPYYGGTAGSLKGHKFSLYEGGIRMPAIMNWPGHILPGQVIDEPVASMDVFPTILNAAGGDLANFELDGSDILPVVTTGAPSPHETLFWEMNKQTAVRQGDWKLVLHGQLVEGTPPEDDVHLANLAEDMGEQVNLAEEFPEKTAELRQLAEEWRAGIEARWEEEFTPKPPGTVTHP
jgi:arylsulfatase A-like enzyme